jgi:predicted CXXCH cytochrome family protein
MTRKRECAAGIRKGPILSLNFLFHIFKFKPAGILSITLASCLALSLLAGCEGKNSYKVLSFFFDGVPSPEEEAAALMNAEDRKKNKERTGIKKGEYTEHGPYAARECTACHVKSSNQLVLPIDQLCFKCHTMNLTKKYVHGPLASGGCRVCHLPHGSAYGFLLVSEPKDFCLYCHDGAAILRREVHQVAQDQQCTMCHDPHGSDIEYLLK